MEEITDYILIGMLIGTITIILKAIFLKNCNFEDNKKSGLSGLSPFAAILGILYAFKGDDK